VSTNAKPQYDSADLLLFQIVHDVRALLRKGHTRAQILQRKLEPQCDAEARYIFEEVFAAHSDLDRLMARLAVYAEAGRAAAYDWVSLDVAILGAKLQFKTALEEAGAQLSVSDTAGIRVSSSIQTVLAELFANAIRFRDPNRPLRIAISASADGDLHLIRVENNGRSWSANHSEKMFEPLQKLEACPDGFGLGLAISRRIVEGLGGKIWAESAPGGGTFFIEIPTGDSDAAS
jgi:light-regulated signal transduction histidine kinase (bacteriophytochrome)